MKNPEDLFNLIKSMSKSEKRYFKVSSVQHGLKEEKNYIKIFDAIDKQEVYSENKLMKLFPGEKSTNALHAAKSYLYYLILRSLKNFHAGKSTDREIHELLDYVELLYEKQLYKQCLKVLQRASEVASKTEQFLHLLKISNWKYKILREMQVVEDLKEMLNTAPPEELQLIKQYMNFREYDWALGETFIAYKETGHVRNRNEELIYENIIGKRIEDNNNPLSQRAKISSVYISYLNAYFRSDYTQAHKYTKQIIDLIESFPDFEKEYAKTYILTLDNLVLVISRLKNNHEEILDCVAKVRALKGETDQIKGMIFSYSYSMELRYYFITGKFKEGIQSAIELEAEIATHYKKMNSLFIQNTYQDIVYLYFGAMEYGKALKYVNKFLNKEVDVRYNVDCEMHIINLIIHYELGNMDLLEYLLKSTHRFLYKRGRLLQFEACALNFIRNVIHSGKNAYKITEAFINLKEKLLALSEDSFEKRVYEQFDYISWLESKIENRNFANVIRKKSLKANE